MTEETKKWLKTTLLTAAVAAVILVLSFLLVARPIVQKLLDDTAESRADLIVAQKEIARVNKELESLRTSLNISPDEVRSLNSAVELVRRDAGSVTTLARIRALEEDLKKTQVEVIELWRVWRDYVNIQHGTGADQAIRTRVRSRVGGDPSFNDINPAIIFPATPATSP